MKKLKAWLVRAGRWLWFQLGLTIAALVTLWVLFRSRREALSRAEEALLQTLPGREKGAREAYSKRLKEEADRLQRETADEVAERFRRAFGDRP